MKNLFKLTGYIHQNDACEYDFKLIENLMQIPIITIHFFKLLDFSPHPQLSPSTIIMQQAEALGNPRMKSGNLR